jgi:hypothetical protein
MLYTALKADAHWQDFAKVTPAELRSQVVPLRNYVDIPIDDV